MPYYYFAKLDGVYLNYLFLFSKEPLRLRDSLLSKEAILYSKKQIERLAQFHDGIQIEQQFIMFKN